MKDRIKLLPYHVHNFGVGFNDRIYLPLEAAHKLPKDAPRTPAELSEFDGMSSS
jgi:hypothetical protein